MERSSWQFEELVNSIDGIVWEADAQTVRFSFVSQQAERLLGYPVARWLAEPSFWQDHMHPDDRAWAIPFCALATAEQRAHEFEYRMLAADGRTVWLRDIVTVVAEHDQPVKLRGVMVDITERKQAEAVLREREEQYRAIFEASTDGLVINDLDGIIVEVNPAFCAMHGYGREDLIGLPVTLFHGPEEQPVVASYAATVAAGNDFQTEGRHLHLRKDGTAFPVEVHGTAFTYRGQPHILGVVRDVTERDRAEAALREKEEQYRSIFEATSDGLVIRDFDGIIVEANPAFCEMRGYTREEVIGRPLTTFIHPDYRHIPAESNAVIQSGGIYHGHSLGLRKDGTPFHVEARGTAFTYRGKPHVLAVTRDISERVQAYEVLEQRVVERTRELSTVLEMSRTMTATLDLQPVLELFLEHLQVVADYDRASVAVVEGESLVVLGSRVPATLAEPDALVGVHYPLARIAAIWDSIRRREPVIVADLHADGPLERCFRTAAGADYAARFGDQRAWLAVPLLRKDQVIGMLALSSTTPAAYTPDQAALVLAIANQAAVAIENARLYAKAQDETRKTAALAQIASRVALGGSLEATLNEVARNVIEASGALACNLITMEGAPPRPLFMGAYGLPDGYMAALEAAWRGGARYLSAPEHYYQPRPIITRNLWQTVLAQPDMAPLQAFKAEIAWDTVISLPTIYQGRHLGRLNLFYPPAQEPSEAEISFLAAIADQAAIAVENARLYATAQDKAALEERQRLARELHDSVSQALYGIVLGAQTARTLLDRDPARVAEPLDYVLSQAEAGLTEMRALIFELRPESLATEGLVAALGKRVAALQARHGLAVDAALGDEPALSLAAKEALYRIAQEALQNVIKHAQASAIAIRLARQGERVLLEIRDDGLGFATGGSFPGHLGLISMRERAVTRGGGLEIDSAPGRGTTVRAWVPCQNHNAETQP